MARVGAFLIIGVACHDAGGAEILASYCYREKANYKFSLKGPAVRIFRRKFGNFENVEIDELIDSVEELFTGTSGNSEFEIQAIKMAKIKGIKCKSFIDHWVNYEMRFTDSVGQLILPDVFVAGDTHAEKILKSVFPNHPIEFIENPYWKEVRDHTILNDKKEYLMDRSKCIFLSEGISEFQTKKYQGLMGNFDERNLLVSLAEGIKEIDFRIKKIVVRLHPSEESSKYDEIESRFGGLITVSRSNLELWEELSKYNLAIGFQSMALVIAMQMGLRVVSIRPIGHPDIDIPFQNIERLEVII